MATTVWLLLLGRCLHFSWLHTDDVDNDDDHDDDHDDDDDDDDDKKLV